jgi:hypothetical protein
MTTEERKQITIETLGDGAVLTRLNDELQRVLENISSPDTRPEALRRISLEIKIRSNTERNLARVDISSSSQLAPVNVLLEKQDDTPSWLKSFLQEKETHNKEDE